MTEDVKMIVALWNLSCMHALVSNFGTFVETKYFFKRTTKLFVSFDKRVFI